MKVTLSCGEAWVDLEVTREDLLLDTGDFVTRFTAPATHTLLNLLEPDRSMRLIREEFARAGIKYDS